MTTQTLSHVQPRSLAPYLWRLTEVLDVARQRRQLARLDAHRLNDLGLTKAEAAVEAARPFWQMPAAPRRW